LSAFYLTLTSLRSQPPPSCWAKRQKPAKNEIKKIREITYLLPATVNGSYVNAWKKTREITLGELIFGEFKPVRTTYTKLAVSRQTAGETIRKL
jgi:hypothetical protein